MAMWTFRDNETIEWDGTISCKNNLVVGGNVNSKGTGDNYFLGNVGIGTTSPNLPLVVGTSSNSNSNYLFPLRLQGYGVLSDGSGYGSFGGLILNSNTEYTVGSHRFLITNAINGDSFGILRSADAMTDPTLGNYGVVASGVADFVINYLGNVGIGTTRPNAALTASSALYDPFKVYADGTMAMVVTSGANVGIGISNPGAILHAKSTQELLRLETTTARGSGNNYLQFYDPTGAKGYVGWASSNDNMYLSNLLAGNLYILTNTKGITILSTGKVGIGTTSPIEGLHVSGAIASTGFSSGYGSAVSTGMLDYIDTDNVVRILGFGNASTISDFGIRLGKSNNVLSYVPFFIQGSTGNTGIGTSLPEHLLQVSGSGAITGYGGYAIKLRTADAVSGGWIVRASASNSHCAPCGLADGYAQGNDMPIGAVYHTTPLTAAGQPVWVVVSGRARVMHDGVNTVSGGYFLKTSPETSGAVQGEEDPPVPADANHWREIGHSLQYVSGAKLFDAVLHFN